MRRFVFFPALAVAVALFAVAAGAAWLASGTGSSSGRSTSLGMPTTVAASATGSTSIQVTWNAPAAPSPAPTTYDVFRYIGGTGTKICSAVSSTAPRVCNDSGLTPSTTYGYTVEARLGANWMSGQTALVNATTNAPPATPNFLVEQVVAGDKTAGTAFQVRITARTGTTTDTTYAGNKNLTFSGPGQNSGFAAPTYPANPVSFVAGVATVPVTLRKAETATLTVSEGGRAGSTSVTVVAGATSILRYTSSSKDCSSGTVFLNANGGTWSSKVTRLDASGNLVTAGTLTVGVAKPSGAGGSTPTTPLTIDDEASESATATSYTIATGQPPAVTITASAAGVATSAACAVDR
jgi:hypothetical protein